MKILFYNHTGQASGAERLLAMILARLDREVFEPVLVCPEAGALAKMAADVRVPVETLAALKAQFTWRPDHLVLYCWSFFKVIRELRRKVTALKPDLIHANSIRAGLVATAATFALGTRVVWHLHDLLPRHPLSTAIRVFALLSTRTRMIAVSEAVARNFRGGFSRLLKNRVSVILNGIDVAKFQAIENVGENVGENAREATRAEFRLGPDDFVIGIIGQLTPRKGQLELIAAFAQAELARATLLIVGAPLFNRDQDYGMRLEEEAKARGVAERVRMLGARSDVSAIMQALDLLVVNSTAEPFGLVIVEAMACGTPVLAAAVDGIPEIIEHGVNGWLVPARDENTLTAAIMKLSRRPELRARLAIAGRRHVAAHFSAERYMNDLEGFYQDLCEAGGHASPKVKPSTLAVGNSFGVR